MSVPPWLSLSRSAADRPDTSAVSRASSIASQAPDRTRRPGSIGGAQPTACPKLQTPFALAASLRRSSSDPIPSFGSTLQLLPVLTDAPSSRSRTRRIQRSKVQPPIEVSMDRRRMGTGGRPNQMLLPTRRLRSGRSLGPLSAGWQSLRVPLPLRGLAQFRQRLSLHRPVRHVSRRLPVLQRPH